MTSDAREIASAMFDWLARHTQLELSYSGWDVDDGWEVHAVHGGRNDREWTLIAREQTPLEALMAARAELERQEQPK
jgi:hypothetical protein